MSNTNNFDVVIVGAGSSGSAAAYFLSQKGYKVALLDKNSLDKSGAKWICDVPPWMFDVAGIALPEPPERVTNYLPCIISGKNNLGRLKIPLRPMWGIHMPLLIKRLQQDAILNGVKVFENIKVLNLEFNNYRPCYINIKVPSSNNLKKNLRLKSKLFIDASGYNRALCKMVPNLYKDCPDPINKNICHAAQYI